MKPARRTVLCSLLLLLQIWVALAQAATTAQVVVPNALANAEGNSSTSDPFTSSSFRLQQVFDASQFSFLGSTSYARIDSISFRLDGASANQVSFFFGGGSVTLSTTQRSPDGLSSTFADNVGGNAVTVFNGAFGLGGLVQPEAMPQPFNQGANISGNAGSFFYVPSQGNLLVDIIGRSGQVALPGAFDAQSTFGDSVSRVFANSELLTSGTVDSLGLVTRFNLTIIPEPSIAAFMIVGAGMTMLSLRRRSGDRFAHPSTNACSRQPTSRPSSRPARGGCNPRVPRAGAMICGRWLHHAL